MHSRARMVNEGLSLGGQQNALTEGSLQTSG